MVWRICVIRDHFILVLPLLSRYQNSRTPVWNEAGDLRGSRQATESQWTVQHFAGLQAALHCLTQKTKSNRPQWSLAPLRGSSEKKRLPSKAEMENSRSTALAIWCKWTLRMSVYHIRAQKRIIMVILGPEQITSGLAYFGLMDSAEQRRDMGCILERVLN